MKIKIPRILTLIILIISTFSCQTTKEFVAHDNLIKVAAVGDSITYGLTVKNRKYNSYPSRLKAYLGENWLVENFGLSGATLVQDGDKPYRQSKEFKKVLDFNPNIIVILLGTNDTKQQNWISRDHYINEYLKLISYFKNLESNPRVYICSPTPVISEKWGIRNQIIENEIIDALAVISKESGAEIIDLYSNFYKDDMYYSDKIHPNSLGTYLIAKEVFQTIIRGLESL